MRSSCFLNSKFCLDRVSFQKASSFWLWDWENPGCVSLNEYFLNTIKICRKKYKVFALIQVNIQPNRTNEQIPFTFLSSSLNEQS